MPEKSIIKKPRKSFLAFFKDTGWRHLLGLGVALYAIFPILFVISSALNPQGTLTGSSKLFQSVSVESFIRMLTGENGPFNQWFINTIIIASATSIISVFLGALAAYAFSRMRFSGRRMGLLTLLLVQMFPQLLAVVAIYLIIIRIGDIYPAIGLDTKAGLIMIYLGGALGVNTYLMYGFFNTIPQSLDEAAKIDGAGHARIFFTMILRLVSPILAVVALLSFITVTNDYVIASVILVEPENKTLAVGLYELVSNPRYADWSAFSAGAIMSAIPVMIIFLALQRYIVSGLTAGSVK